MAKKVKCRDCGFLCERDDLIKLSSDFEKLVGDGIIFREDPKSREKIECTWRDLVFEAYKETHKNQVESGGETEIQDLGAFDKIFWCFKESTDSFKFLSTGRVASLGKVMISADISNPIECNYFFPYHKGLTPAEHVQLEIEERRYKRTNIIAIMALLFSLLAILWNIYVYLK